MPQSQQLEYEATIRDALQRRSDRPAPTHTTQQGPLQQRKSDRASFILAAGRIRPDPEQVRQLEKNSDDADLQQLAASIRECGLRNPVEVRWIEADDTYQIVSGERRFLAMT
ncbi:MAG: ParB N-terminal domain-containing protein, partial [Planctomycetes bacterium]|nr:ParB N-terminal domain-containing protein [Planctomycetota bacterium]